VSVSPLMIKRPPARVGELTLCVTMTLVLTPLGGIFLEDLPPQETKPTLAQTRIDKTATALFKPEAPNDMKNGDLTAKLWIITERAHGSIRLLDGPPTKQPTISAWN
jgi:hypothetical protein